MEKKMECKEHFIITYSAGISENKLATLRLKWKNCHFEVFVSLDTLPRTRNLDKKRRNLHLNTNTHTGAEGLRARAENGIEAECDDGSAAPAVWRGY